ncbi:DUF397 domain-containing protein [Streptomyces sp. NBC_01214]|uniref:DUF397 domain-containing protein n=1 Tax=Streptomyces sp. NBC_01214 TaxID=2903777 RepID=UPI0022569A80|nr:DUF397 domain-containing protein [Streptomyces sp. NBC_01214]MCX4801973.1 DUF397 domain-containing protein [Streptomyces sp. NBC_01214]
MSIRPSVGDPSALEWVKSSYSASDSNECVEVAHTPGTVLVRDSKRPDDARLAVTPAAWSGFVAHAVAS